MGPCDQRYQPLIGDGIQALGQFDGIDLRHAGIHKNQVKQFTLVQEIDGINAVRDPNRLIPVAPQRQLVNSNNLDACEHRSHLLFWKRPNRAYVDIP